jgi:acylphosphatase
VTAVRAIVSGRVQGVGFRDWTRATAARLGVAGWVRNLDDGTVELAARGEAEAVEALLDACRSGPPPAAPNEVARRPDPEPDAPPPADARPFPRPDRA